MPSKTFPTIWLQGLAWGEDYNNLALISDEITGTGRWSISHEMIFKDLESGKTYLTYYSVGATEYQDESPFEHDGEELACVEVAPVERVIIVYEPVKD